MSAFAYSITDAVRVSGIGRTKLFAEIAAGRLPARKFGSRTLILATDLQAFLERLPRCPSTRVSVDDDAGSERPSERR